MSLRSIYKNANDDELASLYKLDLLVSDDIEDIAVNWMMLSKGDNEVAFLASKKHASLNQIRMEMEKAFKEIGVSIPSQKIALKILLKYHLEQILNDHENYMYHLHELVELDHRYGGKIELFKRPDCDAYFEKRNKKYPNTKSTKFAAQEFGIEKLYGLYYLEDDFDKWTKKLEAKRKSRAIEEARLVLDKFYSD